MKKEYAKPTVRSHELRCSRMMAGSPGEQSEIKTLKIMRRGGDSGSGSSSDSEYDPYDMPEFAD